MSPADRTSSLAALLDGTSIVSLTLTGSDESITLRRDASTSHAPSAAAEMPGRTICAPSGGVFRVRHPMLSEALAERGRSVTAGEIVGLIQIGPLYRHVTATVAGTVSDILAADGDVVGYGTPLLRLMGTPA